MDTKNYDLLVVGWGKAGKTLAKKAARAGMNVAVIERDPKMYGGTCINIGCLPTKSLVHSATVLRQAEDLGLARTDEFNRLAYRKAVEYKRQFVAALNAKNYALLADEKTVDVHLGRAKFVDAHTVQVENAQGELTYVSAPRVVINTGAESRWLPIPGARESARVHTSTELLELSELPSRLLIIGSGFIGLEFASYFANFGSQVSVFQFDGSFLPTEDEDDSLAIRHRLEEQGVNFHFHTSAKKFSDVEGGVRVEVSYLDEAGNEATRVEEYDQVLLAAGRVPATAELGLAEAGIELEGAAVKVDALLRTNVPGVYAVGDVKGGPQFTFISLDDSRIVWPQLLGQEPAYSLAERTSFATTTFIDPPYARVGLNEKEARAAGYNFTVKKLPTLAIPKAHVIREKAGHTKILVGEQDQILGAVVFHYEAAEQINLLSLALKKGIKASELASFIYTHPTFTESLNDVLA